MDHTFELIFYVDEIPRTWHGCHDLDIKHTFHDNHVTKVTWLRSKSWQPFTKNDNHVTFMTWFQILQKIQTWFIKQLKGNWRNKFERVVRLEMYFLKPLDKNVLLQNHATSWLFRLFWSTFIFLTMGTMSLLWHGCQINGCVDIFMTVCALSM